MADHKFNKGDTVLIVYGYGEERDLIAAQEVTIEKVLKNGNFRLFGRPGQWRQTGHPASQFVRHYSPRLLLLTEELRARRDRLREIENACNRLTKHGKALLELSKRRDEHLPTHAKAVDDALRDFYLSLDLADASILKQES